MERFTRRVIDMEYKNATIRAITKVFFPNKGWSNVSIFSDDIPTYVENHAPNFICMEIIYEQSDRFFWTEKVFSRWELLTKR